MATNATLAGSEIRQLIERFDWSATPLGPLELWPQGQQTALLSCLASSVPMALWLGPELVLCYNDAWHLLLGGPQVWGPGWVGQGGAAEQWATIAPALRDTLATGRANLVPNLPLAVARPGAHHGPLLTWFFSPIYDAASQVLGVSSAIAALPAPVSRTEAGLSPQAAEPAPAPGDDTARTQVEQALTQLEAILNHLPLGLAFFDRELRCVRVNAELARMHGRPAEEQIGQPLEALLGDAAAALRPRIEQVFATGEGIYEVELSGPSPAPPDEVGRALASWYPVMVGGATVLVGAVVQQITARKGAEESLRHLHRVTARLAEAQSLAEVRRVILEEFRGALEANGVGLRRVVNKTLVWEELVPGPGVPAEVISRFAHVPLDAAHPAAEVARSGAAVFTTSAETFVERYPQLADALAGSDISAHAHLPLRRDDAVVGVLSLSFATPRAWDEAERAFALALADRAAGAYERAQLLAELHRSEARYRSLVEASAQVVWSATPDGRLFQRRWRWSRMSGIPLAELPEEPLDLVHPADREAGSLAWQAAIARVEPLSFEQRVRGADGRYRTWQVRAAPVLEADGRVREWVGTDADITAHKQAEQALQESEQQLRLITNGMPALISYVDSQRRYQFVNRTYSEWFGLKREEVVGRAMWEVLGEAAYSVARPAIDRALEGHGVTYERLLPYKHGGTRYVQATYIPDHHPDGTVKGFFVLVVDLTERKRAEDQLRYQTRLLEALTESALDGILIVSPEGRMLHYNQQFLDIWQFPPEIIEAQSDERALAWAASQTADPPAFLARVTEVYGQPDHQVREELAMGDGRVYERFGAPITDGDTRLGWLWTFRDISERKAAERERERLLAHEQELRRQAEEASRLKDEFLATVSHELRTPLTAFLGYAQLLRSHKRDEAYVARTVEKMVQSAQAQAQLIEDLLDISRIVSGRLRIDPAPVDLSEVIRVALDTVRPATVSRQLTLLAEFDPAAVRVFGDANRLQQVVWNLLANAVKFTPPGGAISIQVERDGSNALLSVSDTGQGIAPDFLPYVFDRFRQADGATNRSSGGLGLGLAIVRHLVELHGGSVAVSSDGLGHGATFSVRLPLTGGGPSAAPATGTPASIDADDNCPPELIGLRVLVVDDQPALLELLEEILASCGAEVRACGNARAALAALQSWQPQVLVSDIAMPGEDGYWLISQVRALPPERGGAVPALALTAYVRIEDRLRVLAAGFEQYVPKPVEPDELRAVVAHLARPAGRP